MSEMATLNPPRTWIFQANPKLYDIDAALKSLPEMSWSVRSHKNSIHPGDAVFIWKSGPEAGILASATVLSAPAMLEQDGLQFAVQADEFEKQGLRVRLRIESVYPVPLSRDVLRARLPDLSILRAPQGTNFTVTAEEAAVIRNMLATQDEAGDEVPRANGEPVSGSRVWVYSPGPKAQFWEEFYREGIMAIGWDALGDLKQYSDPSAIAAKLTEAYHLQAFPMNDSRACYDFLHSIKPGDQVIAKRGRDELIGYGIVVGEYEFRPERSTYRNVRQIRWERRGNWKSKPVLATKTLTEFTPYPEDIQYLTELIGVSDSVSLAPDAPVLPPYSVDDALKGVAFDKGQFETILDFWRTKKNLILQGPPGVGKTFLARKLAYSLIGHEMPSRVSMVQFHQSYSYEDFIQGYRPVESGFARQDGVFVRFCRRASLDQDSTYVFIIDEINRANLSKVFGELLMLIEADKRGSKNSLALTYSASDDEQFYVPSNVYILGMMNTADRSLALVDYALRRRFGFVELEPLFGCDAFTDFLIAHGAESGFAKDMSARLQALNAAIAEDQNLGPGFAIGHSYFCGNGAFSEKSYLQTFRYEILPLLKEYWFDDKERVEEWADRLGAKFTQT